jgi:multidrug efflux pump subunit AcrA (membrane-fusion protein)
MKQFFFRTTLFSTAFFMLMCSGHKNKNEETPKVTVTVKLAAVRKGPIELVETAPGRTDVDKKEKILSPVAGRIIQQTKQAGAKVTAGEIIAVIRTKESDVALTGAQTLLSEARTEDQKTDAQRTVKLAEESQNSLSLRAPFTGIVTSRATNVNELVSENTELYTIIDLSTLNFIADVPLATAVRLHTGQQGSVRFDALPNEVMAASVTDISGQADLESQNVKVRFKFADPPSRFAALKTDMPGVVRIHMGVHPNVLLVPKAALLRNDETNSYSLTTITRDSLSRTVGITVGVSNDSMTEITGGNIQEGMPVLTDGYYGLTDSTRITAAR